MSIPFHRSPAKQLAALLALTFLQSSCGQAAWRMEPLPERWSLSGFENSLDLSGIASADGTRCLVGSDESYHIQPGVIDHGRKSILAHPAIPLPIDLDVRKPEVDIEGVAYSPGERAYYVVGSHGVGKKKGDIQPLRHSIYRIPVDGGGAVDPSGIRKTSLRPWLDRTPVLAPFVGLALQRNGLNIEGLASSRDRLFLGLRAPNRNGRALVIEVRPDELFNRPARPLKVHELAISAGRGIREITAVRDGFVILTGNASAEASKKIPDTMAPGPDVKFELLHWSGRDAKPTRISALPNNGGKAEGLLVLEDTPAHVTLLVVFDGIPGGEPLAVRLHRGG